MRRSEKNTDPPHQLTLTEAVIRSECLFDHFFFSRYFFKQRQSMLFLQNWHHFLVSEKIQAVIDGKIKNIIFNVPPGSSKTELVVINLIARGIALNPRARFLHLSYSDDLALQNSQTARDLILSDEYQALWPMPIADDSKAKKRWNIMLNGKPAGGVYATSLSGQITGFRAGHMAEGWQGAIIIDDPLKPEDAFSESKLNAANRKLLTTVKSRKANPDTPIILIMQRISENDPTGFILNGNLPGEWEHVKIPAVIDEPYVKSLPSKYQAMLKDFERTKEGRFSYWPYKEPIKELLSMEAGEGVDQSGARISRYVFASQYQQSPVAVGGNIIKGHYFIRYKVPPKIRRRKIFVDTAQKTAERNDYSVFECWGLGDDGKIYLIDMIRGKWEAPELKKRAIAFWGKHKALDVDDHGSLTQMMVEDKSSGTGLVQEIKLLNQIPVKGIERVKDKLTRVMDGVTYIEAGMVAIPEDAPFTADFVSECEAFTADDSHSFDDQIDPMLDAIVDFIAAGNKVRQWENLI